MNPTKLDHVAYWVADRDPIADFVTAHLGMHVIDRTERFTLLGSNARRGKITLFDADGPRERGALGHVAFRVSDLAAATGIADATVSQTLRYLRASQTVIAEREGRVVRYRLASTPVAALLSDL